jgi:hypothetical protein
MHEIGIRAVPGSSGAGLPPLVLRGGMALAGIGLPSRPGGAQGLTRLHSNPLQGAAGRDPLPMDAAAVLALTVLLASSSRPAG